MTDEQIKAVVPQVLGSIAPEVDISQNDPVSDLREQIDIDLYGYTQLNGGYS